MKKKISVFLNNTRMKDYDYELYSLVKKEIQRQENNINLIASENYASYSVMKMQGSCLTNKYAEGYPNKRYYAGCEIIDEIEKLAIKRAKLLFNVDYVNVQSHSGSQANFSVYNALLHPGDVIISMELTHGGHLTHGSVVNFSGKLYRVFTYGTTNKGDIDYDELYRLSVTHKPKMIIGGFSSYSGIVDWSRIRQIADVVNAYFFVDMSHIAGLVIGGVYPNPIPYAHVLTATTHKTLSGPRGGIILSNYGNKKLYDLLDSSVFPGTQGGPLMHIIAAKAISFKEAMDDNFKQYQKKIVQNSKRMVNIFIDRGFNVVFGYTANHLFLINLVNKKITGKKACYVLSKANIIVNKNSIPNDVLSPSVTSGIRIGTAAVTKRGISNKDIFQLTNWICDILEDTNNEVLINSIKKKVLNMCSFYPIY